MPTPLVSETVTRLALERQRDDELVKAEASLVGERVISLIRLLLFFLFGLSVALPILVGDEEFHPDSVRLAAVALYFLISVGTIITVLRTTPDAKRALRVPIVMIAIDYGFLFVMGWRRFVVDHLARPEVGAAAFAVIICFSVCRFSRLHVWLSVAFSVVTFTAVTWLSDRLTLSSIGFVLGSYLALGILISWANGYLQRMFVDVRRRENLARFLPRQIAERVLKNGAMLEPAQREVTILFTDIRDFTSLSEKLPPREVLAFLDRYFGHMSQIVKGHDGLVNKFLGDGMLAVWGVPDRDEQHPEKALKAALDMRRKLVEFNQERANEGLPPIRMGIGIHTGVVAAGMLGGADQHEYTVIGDAVNLASRIEGLTKTLSVDLLVSESTWAKLPRRYQGRRAAEEKVKGRVQPVVVYAVEGLSVDSARVEAASA